MSGRGIVHVNGYRFWQSMEELSAVAIVVVVVVEMVLGVLLLILWRKREDFGGFAGIFGLCCFVGEMVLQEQESIYGWNWREKERWGRCWG